MKTLLISIYPRHSQNILAGRKSIELRKSPFKQKDGSPVFDRLLIYETHPTSAIVGYCKAVEVMEKSSFEWTRDYKDNLCLTSKEIYDYLHDHMGGRMGFGIKLRNPQKITPIPLSRMRELGISAPQGYRYISAEMIEKLGIEFNA